jgi:hypothetical protein
MNRSIHRLALALLLAAPLIPFTASIALAHGHTEVGDYELVIGFHNEPAPAELRAQAEAAAQAARMALIVGAVGVVLGVAGIVVGALGMRAPRKHARGPKPGPARRLAI